MARLPRIDIPGLPQHLIVRGNNRGPCFGIERDYRVYLRYLEEAGAKCDCAVHAYVLMTNHVHLLVTGNRSGAISRLMHSIGCRYVRYFNSAYGRTGTLFEGRFHASVVESERYFLACMRYIDLNPVRAGIVRDPAEYRWSSHRHYVGRETRTGLTPHGEFLRLGASPGERHRAYRELVDDLLAAPELKAIREHVNRNRVLGRSAFQASIRAIVDRPVAMASAGRPRGRTI